MLPLQRIQVWSLLEELRFNMPCRKKEKNEGREGEREGRRKGKKVSNNLKFKKGCEI